MASANTSNKKRSLEQISANSMAEIEHLKSLVTSLTQQSAEKRRNAAVQKGHACLTSFSQSNQTRLQASKNEMQKSFDEIIYPLQQHRAVLEQLHKKVKETHEAAMNGIARDLKELDDLMEELKDATRDVNEQFTASSAQDLKEHMSGTARIVQASMKALESDLAKITEMHQGDLKNIMTLLSPVGM